MDVGVELVELTDVVIQNCLQLGTHGVCKFDGNFAAIVALSRNRKVALDAFDGAAIVGGAAIAAASCQGQGHSCQQNQCEDSFHSFNSFLYMKFIPKLFYTKANSLCF